MRETRPGPAKRGKYKSPIVLKFSVFVFPSCHFSLLPDAVVVAKAPRSLE